MKKFGSFIEYQVLGCAPTANVLRYLSLFQYYVFILELAFILEYFTVC